VWYHHILHGFNNHIFCAISTAQNQTAAKLNYSVAYPNRIVQLMHKFIPAQKINLQDLVKNLSPQYKIIHVPQNIPCTNRVDPDQSAHLYTACFVSEIDYYSYLKVNSVDPDLTSKICRLICFYSGCAWDVCGVKGYSLCCTLKQKT
jgi:hypothetical protein